jgi:cytochrome c553
MRMIWNTAILAAFWSASVFAADTAAGKDVCDKSCKSCHGADGTPNAGVAKMMRVEMTDLKAAKSRPSSLRVKGK